MKKFLLIVIAVFFLFTVTTVHSQSKTNNYQTRIGLGITLTDFKELFTSIIMDEGILTPTIFIPIKVSPKFRIEPEIGFFQISSDYSDEDSKYESTGKIFQLGVGICPMVTRNSFDLYYGARVGYLSVSSSEEYTSIDYSDKDEESASGFFIAPLLGGEYYFSEHFSLGGEAQLKYSSLSLETEYDSDKEESSSSKIFTSSTVFIRIYF